MHDIASLEAKISSLDANSFMVLSKLADTRNNDDIVRWSGGWNFSHRMIEHSLRKIYALFDLDHLNCPEEKRRAAAQLYTAFATAFSRRGVPDAAQHTEQEETSTMKESQDILVTIDDTAPVCAKLRWLSKRKLDTVECMVKGWGAERTAQELGLALSTIRQYYYAIYCHLELPQSMGRKRRDEILRQAYELYKNTPRKIVAQSHRLPPHGEVAKANGSVEEMQVDTVSDDELPEDDPPSQPALLEDLPPLATCTQGVAVKLDDPSSICAVKIICMDDADLSSWRGQGFRLEHVVLCPASVPEETLTYGVLVSRWC